MDIVLISKHSALNAWLTSWIQSLWMTTCPEGLEIEVGSQNSKTHGHFYGTSSTITVEVVSHVYYYIHTTW